MFNQMKNEIIRLAQALRYSIQGLIAVARQEAAFRLEMILTVMGIPAALCLGKNKIEVALLITVLLLVLIVELLNSAVETVIDRIGSEHHELSGRAKDIASAAVFVTVLNAIAVWLIVLLF